MSALDFSEWVNTEMAIRGWNLSELARAAHITPTALEHGLRLPRLEFCHALARAFNTYPDKVLRLAGLLPPDPEEARRAIERRERIEYLANFLDEDDLKFIHREAIRRLNEQAEKHRASWTVPEPNAAFNEEMGTLLPRISAADRGIMLSLAYTLAERTTLQEIANGI